MPENPSNDGKKKTQETTGRIKIGTNVRVALGVLGLAVIGAIVGLIVLRDQGPWVAPPESKALVNPVKLTVAEMPSVTRTYIDHCARCHGDQGNGDGPDAKMYKPLPTVLSDANLMGRESDGEIFWKIGEGRRPMPAFSKDLTAPQRWQLVNYIRSLAHSAAP